MWEAQKGLSLGETGLVHFMENVEDAGKIVSRGEKKSHKTGQGGGGNHKNRRVC